MVNDSSISLKADNTAIIMKTPRKTTISLIQQFARTYAYAKKSTLSGLILN